jgi:hypothetical protein
VIDKKVGCIAVSRLNGETDLPAAYLGPLDGAAVLGDLADNQIADEPSSRRTQVPFNDANS